MSDLDTFVSESDILGPIDYFSDIEILVSFERGMFADYFKTIKWRYSYFHVYITTLKYMPKASKTVYMSNKRVSHFYQYICGQFYKIMLQRYDTCTTYLKNFDMETQYPVFVGQ